MIVSDSKISRIGTIQGLNKGSLQTSVFLWSPALCHVETKVLMGILGLDKNGEPVYGLIFGAFMVEGEGKVCPVAIKLIASISDFIYAGLLEVI
eukprot:9032085-Ditylum_brightwellii.AAC.1